MPKDTDIASPYRRKVLGAIFSAMVGLSTQTCLSMPSFGSDIRQLVDFQGEDVFNRIRDKALTNNWIVLPIGELIGKIANEFLGVSYKANTLELSADSEICSVNLTAFDCVTFFETSLAFARMLKEGGRTPKDLLHQVSFIRYRSGRIGDYSTRLHYTTDWFADNETKHVVQVLSMLPGSEAITQRVGIMSAHPENSPQLAAKPMLVAKIRSAEDAINKRSMKFVPMNKIASVEHLLKTGDIVAVCTNIHGLDVVHTGLVMRTADGVAHFLDATSKKSKMMVALEPGPISQALQWSKTNTGAIFARPLEPT